MNTQIQNEIDDLNQLIVALQRSVAAQAAEIDRLQERLDNAHHRNTDIVVPAGYRSTRVQPSA